jgi:hypothetical protein
MLHILKVALLVLLTLAVMRAVSWGVGWVVARAWRTRPAPIALAANATSLAAFAAFLVWNLMPGEPFDYAPLAFGVVVYLACFLADLWWRPWQGDAS